MANKYRGEIVFDLDRPRTWRLNYRAISEIENALAQLRGRKVRWFDYVASVREWGIDDFALVLWAGLYVEDKQVTLEQVMDWADCGTLQAFQLEFNEILQDSIPERFKKKVAEIAAQLEKIPQGSENSSAEPVVGTA